MSVRPVTYAAGPHRTGSKSVAFLQPDGHYGLNNAAAFMTSDGALMVDAAYDLPRARRIVEAFVQPEANPVGRIAVLALTHEHGDHVYGACVVPAPRVIMAERAAAGMAALPRSLPARLSTLGTEGRSMLASLLQDKFDFTGVALRAPTQTFSGQTSVEVGGSTFTLIEFTDCHTASDTVVFDARDGGVVATGDLMFADSHIPLFTPHARRWADALARLLELPSTTFVPGHGRLCTRADVREHREYLLWLLDAAQRASARGLTPDEAADELAADLRPWATLQRPDVIVNSLAVAYREVQPDYPAQSYDESLAQRWRFRARWRGRLPGLDAPLELNPRLGGLRTLRDLELRITEEPLA